MNPYDTLGEQISHNVNVAARSFDVGLSTVALDSGSELMFSFEHSQSLYAKGLVHKLLLLHVLLLRKQKKGLVESLRFLIAKNRVKRIYKNVGLTIPAGFPKRYQMETVFAETVFDTLSAEDIKQRIADITAVITADYSNDIDAELAEIVSSFEITDESLNRETHNEMGESDSTDSIEDSPTEVKDTDDVEEDSATELARLVEQDNDEEGDYENRVSIPAWEDILESTRGKESILDIALPADSVTTADEVSTDEDEVEEHTVDGSIVETETGDIETVDEDVADSVEEAAIEASDAVIEENIDETTVDSEDHSVSEVLSDIEDAVDNVIASDTQNATDETEDGIEYIFEEDAVEAITEIVSDEVKGEADEPTVDDALALVEDVNESTEIATANNDALVDAESDIVSKELENNDITNPYQLEAETVEPEVDEFMVGLVEPPEDGFLYEDQLNDVLDEELPWEPEDDGTDVLNGGGRQIVVEKLVVQQQITEQSTVQGQNAVIETVGSQPVGPVRPGQFYENQTPPVQAPVQAPYPVPQPIAVPQRPVFRPTFTPEPENEPAASTAESLATSPESHSPTSTPLQPAAPSETSVTEYAPPAVEDNIAPQQPVQKQQIQAEMEVVADSVNITNKGGTTGNSLIGFDPTKYLNLSRLYEEEIVLPEDNDTEDNNSDYPTDGGSTGGENSLDTSDYTLDEPEYADTPTLDDSARVNQMLRELRQLRGF